MAGTAPPQIPGCRDLSLIGERVARSLYAATSDTLGRAVTVIAYPPLAEGRTWDDFDEAAATAQRLGVHPSMISIHEWGHAGDGRPWIVTDPQPAEALDTVLKLDGPLEPERALQVGVLLAGALETAHGAGIVHGDLSPARLVLGSHGEPLMTETGLAPFAVFPGLGALNNPVRYHAPPEVLERTEITTATDVYSLASTVYALIAGRAPHEKPAEVTDSNASLLLRVLQLPVPAIERPGLPPWLLEALRAPLSPDPGKRPQQAIEVAWLLQDVQRRAGFAVTEPVVLDLDDIENQRSRRATGGAMASSRTARGAWPAPLSAPAPGRTRPRWRPRSRTPSPPPLRQAATYSFPDTAPAPNGRSDDAEAPAPTIFPFAVPDAPDAPSGNGTSHWPPALRGRRPRPTAPPCGPARGRAPTSPTSYRPGRNPRPPTKPRRSPPCGRPRPAPSPNRSRRPRPAWPPRPRPTSPRGRAQPPRPNPPRPANRQPSPRGPAPHRRPTTAQAAWRRVPSPRGPPRNPRPTPRLSTRRAGRPPPLGHPRTASRRHRKRPSTKRPPPVGHPGTRDRHHAFTHPASRPASPHGPAPHPPPTALPGSPRPSPHPHRRPTSPLGAPTPADTPPWARRARARTDGRPRRRGPTPGHAGPCGIHTPWARTDRRHPPVDHACLHP